MVKQFFVSLENQNYKKYKLKTRYYLVYLEMLEAQDEQNFSPSSTVPSSSSSSVSSTLALSELPSSSSDDDDDSEEYDPNDPDHWSSRFGSEEAE